MAIFTRFGLIPSHLLSSLRCDKYVSRNTSPQITSSNEVREQCRFPLGHSLPCLGQFIDQKLCVTQQINREGALQYSGSGFTDVFANAGVPAVIRHLTILL